MNKKYQTIVASIIKHFKISKTVLKTIFLCSLLALIIIGIGSYIQIKNLIAANQWVNHTHSVIEKASAALYEITDIESQQRIFLMRGNQHSLMGIDSLKIDLEQNLADLKILTADNAEQNKRVDLFKTLVNKRLDLLTELTQLKLNNQLETPRAEELFNQSHTFSTHVKDLGREIKSVEYSLLKERNSFAIEKSYFSSFILIAANAVSILFLIVAFVLALIEFKNRQRTESINKEMQSHLRQIIESASDMIAAFDKDNCFLIFNEAYRLEFKRIFDKSISIGKKIDDLLENPLEDNKAIAQAWFQSLVGQKELQVVETTVGNKKRTYELKSNPIYNENNMLKGTVHCVDDISNRIQEHTDLQISYQKLAQKMAELEDKNEQINLLVEMSDMLLACWSIDELSKVIAKFIDRILKCSSGYFYIMHPSKNYLEISASWGKPNEQEHTFLPDNCWALRLGRIHKVGAKHQELICEHVTNSLNNQLSFLCVPLMAQNDIYGLLYLESAENDFLSDENQRLLVNAFAELVALALANVRLRDNLRYHSIRDPLTGLYNRRYLEDFLFKQTHLSQREKIPFVILMLDLDYFKKINDSFGHNAGDMVLKELGRILTQDIRIGDIAARYGGEEFIIIFNNIAIEIAEERAESIRQAVSSLKINYGAQPVGSLSISIGIAQYPTDSNNPEELIKKADRALYYAKKNGRNRVVNYSDVQ